MIFRAGVHARDSAVSGSSGSSNSSTVSTSGTPPPPPPSATGSELSHAIGPRVSSSPVAGTPENYIPLFVVIAVLGLALLIMVGMIVYTIARRRRRRRSEAAEDFLSARRRDPSLTWEEYERSRKLTQSTVMLEEERVRVAMIDKSLRSRVSVDQPPLSERAPSIPEEPLPPPAPASPGARANWTSGRLRRQRSNSDGTDDFDSDAKEMLLGGVSPSPVSAPPILQPPHCVWRDIADGGSVGSGTQSSGSRPTTGSGNNSNNDNSNSNQRSTSTSSNSHDGPRPSPSSSQRWLWELPDGKKCPPAWANARWGGDNRDAPPPVPPPSLRTRTPPIWAHPAFRPEGGAGTIVARSFTNDTGIYPSDMARVKPASLV